MLPPLAQAAIDSRTPPPRRPQLRNEKRQVPHPHEPGTRARGTRRKIKTAAPYLRTRIESSLIWSPINTGFIFTYPKYQSIKFNPAFAAFFDNEETIINVCNAALTRVIWELAKGILWVKTIKIIILLIRLEDFLSACKLSQKFAKKKCNLHRQNRTDLQIGQWR